MHQDCWACAPEQEEPLWWEAHTPQLESSLGSPHLGENLPSNKEPKGHEDIKQETKLLKKKEKKETKLLLKERKKGKTNDEKFILKKPNKIEDRST